MILNFDEFYSRRLKLRVHTVIVGNMCAGVAYRPTLKRDTKTCEYVRSKPWIYVKSPHQCSNAKSHIKGNVS